MRDTDQSDERIAGRENSDCFFLLLGGGYGEDAFCA
jgi:hypothetical protein